MREKTDKKKKKILKQNIKGNENTVRKNKKERESRGR